MELPNGLQFSLRGKVAAVTGGVAGSVSPLLRRSLAQVPMSPLLNVSNKNAHEVAKQICDAISAIVSDFGSLDIMVANAGIAASGKTEDFDPEEFKRVHEVNVNGVLYTMQAAANSIITMSSAVAHVVTRPQLPAAYCSSKAAASMLTRCVATEWANQGVRVNANCQAT
ncbi:hypothetical protein BZG36_04239 [Bifiguratus adelaidae]|uniref:Uncharacterized protein n=1 Tax=Bifiguratus adelaidae TaxID=1938954 RepID=A0A261Y0U5_9FUNG|nr:hypothetical protein BZG36_04239 [Bifiguratus adelaidae]